MTRATEPFRTGLVGAISPLSLLVMSEAEAVPRKSRLRIAFAEASLTVNFVLLLIAVGIAAIPTAVIADQVVATISLPASGEPASIDNPPCGNPDATTTADQVLSTLGAAADAYIGYPVVSGALEAAPPEVRNWAKVRLGLHNGPSVCQTACVAIPAAAPAQYQACMTQFDPHSGADQGYGCTLLTSDLNYLNGIWNYGKGVNASTSTREGARLICVTAKNWANTRSRSFMLRAVH